MLPPVPRQVSFRPTGWAAAGATRGRSSRGRRHQKGTLIQYQVRWGCSKKYVRRVVDIFVFVLHSQFCSLAVEAGQAAEILCAREALSLHQSWHQIDFLNLDSSFHRCYCFDRRCPTRSTPASTSCATWWPTCAPSASSPGAPAGTQIQQCSYFAAD